MLILCYNKHIPFYKREKGGRNMKRILKIVGILLIVWMAASMVFAVGYVVGGGKMLQEERSQQEKLQEEVERLTQEAEEEDTDAQDEISDLKKQIADLKAEKASYRSNSTAEYIQKKFYSDGYLYKVEDEDFVFYSDATLETKLGNDVIIVSPAKSHDEFGNGVEVYTCLSEDGFVYSTQEPDLVPLE